MNACRCTHRDCLSCINRKMRKRVVKDALRLESTVPYSLAVLLDDGWSPATIRKVLRASPT